MVLSIGPDEEAEEEEEETITMMSVFEILLLFVRRAGVFVVQAAGNKGPAQATVVSFSPWAFAAAAATTGRSYTSTLVLGNGSHLFGMGLSGISTHFSSPAFISCIYIYLWFRINIILKKKVFLSIRVLYIKVDKLHR